MEKKIRFTSLDTPLSIYIRSTADLQFPTRFYEPKTLKSRFHVDNLADVDPVKMVDSFYKSKGFLTVDDIPGLVISKFMKMTKEKNKQLVEILKKYGFELKSRFSLETKYINYGLESMEADRLYWESNVRDQKNYEKELSKVFESSNNSIMEWPYAPISEPNIIESNIVYNTVVWKRDAIDFSKIHDRDLNTEPIIDGKNINRDDAVDIFNLFPISDEIDGIPYVGYHTPATNRYRISMFATTGGQDPLSETSLSQGGIQYAIHPYREEYTYKNIIQSEYYPDIQGSTCFISFMIRGIFCIMDLDRGTLMMNRIRTGMSGEITDILKKQLNFIDFSDKTNKRITAMYLLPEHHVIYPALFSDLLVNREDYIGFKEEESLQLLKKVRAFFISPIPIVVNELTQSYALLKEIKVVLVNKTATNTELLSMTSSKTGKSTGQVELKKGTNYCEITAYDILDSALLEFTTEFLCRIMGHYIKDIESTYLQIFKSDFGITREGLIKYGIGWETRKGDFYARRTHNIKPIDIIVHKYPEVFVPNYTRQCPHYPEVKDKLDGQDLEFDPKNDKRKSHGSGEWVRYPPTGATEFFYKCPTGQFKYPGIVQNRLRNKGKYPTLLCCFRQAQFVKGKLTDIAYNVGGKEASGLKDSDLSVTHWGPLEYPPVYDETEVLTSDRPMNRGRIGTVTNSIEQALSPLLNEDQEDGTHNIYRYGLSESTMLHAVFLAMDIEYAKLSSSSVEERMKYIRKHITIPYPATLYQEMINVPTDILEKLEQWTYKTHYRILEEFFGVNIYLLVRIIPRDSSFNEPPRVIFEIPNTRSGEPHFRRHMVNRPSVILHITRYIELGTVRDSGVELILHGTVSESSGNVSLSAVWGSKITKDISQLYDQLYSVVSFGSNPLGKVLEIEEEIENETVVNTLSYSGNINLFAGNYLSYVLSKSVGYYPIYQLIDERGLCRSITFSNGSEKFSIVFTPTQPFNLPHNSTIVVSSNYSLIRTIFGEPYSISVDKNGVFYIIEGTRYIFVPIKIGTILFDGYIISDYNPLSGLSPKSFDFKDRWRISFTYLRFLLFVTSWLFQLSPVGTTVENFMKNCIVLDENKHSAWAKDIYDLSGIKRVIRLNDPTVSEGFNLLRKMAPTMLCPHKDAILVTSPKIVDGLRYYLNSIVEQTRAIVSRDRSKDLVMKWNIGLLLTSETVGSSSALLRKDKETYDSEIITFWSASMVRLWFRNLTSLSKNVTSDIGPVQATISQRGGNIIWMHPVIRRLWIIPGITYSLIDAVIACYLWKKTHRVYEVQPPRSETISYGESTSNPSARFSKQRRSTTIDENLSFFDNLRYVLKQYIADKQIIILKYGFTRDKRIELLQKSDIIIEKGWMPEILLSGPDRYTPMLPL